MKSRTRRMLVFCTRLCPANLFGRKRSRAASKLIDPRCSQPFAVLDNAPLTFSPAPSALDITLDGRSCVRVGSGGFHQDARVALDHALQPRGGRPEARRLRSLTKESLFGVLVSAHLRPKNRRRCAVLLCGKVGTPFHFPLIYVTRPTHNERGQFSRSRTRQISHQRSRHFGRFSARTRRRQTV